MKTYKVHRTKCRQLSGVDFAEADTGVVDQVRPESSVHHPYTRFALLHNNRNLYLKFRVNDQYVRAVHSNLHAPVCQDSCVEFFVQPRDNCGYFNFEINAIGTMLISYIEDPVRTPAGFKRFTLLHPDLCRKIEVMTSLKHPVDPETTAPLTWALSLKIPLEIMESCTGRLSCTQGSIWRGNFYKCADKTSHPHWLSWMPLKQRNFHDPDSFGQLRF